MLRAIRSRLVFAAAQEWGIAKVVVCGAAYLQTRLGGRKAPAEEATQILLNLPELRILLHCQLGMLVTVSESHQHCRPGWKKRAGTKNLCNRARKSREISQP